MSAVQSYPICSTLSLLHERELPYNKLQALLTSALFNLLKQPQLPALHDHI